MKTPFAIFLIFLMLFVQTPVRQLLKIPLLVEHFLKHQQQTGISFTKFLEDHYSAQNKDADLQDDEQLPFQGISSYVVFYAIVPATINVTCTYIALPVKRLVRPLSYIPQQQLRSIFHPPRV